ncbi:hypothetical protein [Cyanobium sp. NS01]|uniref:hypothetical protein n=1 Tax=Cyanobium sp. NS01 TaxID=261284 RepID=UPI001647FEBC|nr:hypothetical protein [Cyanobium sp. NS01]
MTSQLPDSPWSFLLDVKNCDDPKEQVARILKRYPGRVIDLEQIADLYCSLIAQQEELLGAIPLVEEQLDYHKDSVGINITYIRLLKSKCDDNSYRFLSLLPFLKSNYPLHYLAHLIELIGLHSIECATSSNRCRNRLFCGIAVHGCVFALFGLYDNELLPADKLSFFLHKVSRSSICVMSPQDMRLLKGDIRQRIEERKIEPCLHSWSTLLSFRKSSAPPKIAVLLSGQFRGYERANEWLKEQFSHYESTFYLATWNQSGFRKPTLTKGTIAQLNRVFSKRVVEFCLRHPNSAVSFFENERMLSSHLSKPIDNGYLAKTYMRSEIPLCNLVVKDESEFAEKHKGLIDDMWTRHPHYTCHSKPTNSSKMVYLNQKCFDLIPNKGDYDVFVRIRPDGYVKNTSVINDAIRDVLDGTIDGYVDRGGGFGDQCIIGNYEAINSYCNLWTSFSTLDLDRSGSIGHATQPHTRLMDKSILDCINVAPIENLNILHDSSSRVSDQELVELLIRECELGSHDEPTCLFLERLLDHIKST